jgi:hypothetical protein
MSLHGFRSSALLGALLAATACVPYTVATTAQPLRAGQDATTLVTYAMPKVGRIDSSRHSPELPVSTLATDLEWRVGLDGRSDMGLRVPNMSGLVVNYKRLLSDTGRGPRSAIIGGAGLVNMGQHAHFEFSWIVSAWEGMIGQPSDSARKLVPYGGLRLMQVVPVVEGALNDRPTVGVFAGARIGTLDLGVSPEIGIFYDHSVLGVRERSIVIIPAVSVHGDRLIDFVRRRPRRQLDAPRLPQLLDDHGTRAPLPRTLPPALHPTGASRKLPPPWERIPRHGAGSDI